MFHAETRRRLVRRIPAEGLDPCGYGVDVFLFASRHLIVVCTQTFIFHCCIVFEAVVCRLYEMLYPCICNVVISCWKSGAYGFVICRGGTDMCSVLGFGRKRPDLKQYRISGLTAVNRRGGDSSEGDGRRDIRKGLRRVGRRARYTKGGGAASCMPPRELP